MSTPSPAGSTPQLRQFLGTLRQYWWMCLLPVAAGLVAAVAYASVRPAQWKASQALLVRDEVGGTLNRQGRFDSNEAMKTAQETIAEICRNQAVAAAALTEVGPTPDRQPENWPTAQDIAVLEQQVSLTAPKGQEFGRSEVIYLSVAAGSPERARALATAVCDQLEARLKELRDRKAHSVVTELEKTAALAEKGLAAATSQLERLEAEVGSDLGELRILNDSGAGDSNLRAMHTQVRNELRQARIAGQAIEEQLRVLVEAQQAPDTLLAAPRGLLESQPALRRLKDGLVDAQLRTAQLRGKMTPDHPEVRAAREAEDAIGRQLRDEAGEAVAALKADLQVSQAQINSLQTQLNDVETRLNRLAALRASYSNLVAESRQCSESLQRAQKDLAEARASQAAAQSASLITRLDQPVVGNSPLGPGSATLLASGTGGGLVVGLALVFLFAPSTTGGRRWSDYVARGRRATDRTAAGGQERRTGFDRRAGDSKADEPVLTGLERRRTS